MTSKYYTPTIEEFHVGFEYERLFKIKNDQSNFEEWKKCVYNISQLNNYWITEDNIKNKLFRVKYLDRSDIESLGWNFLKESIDIQFNKLATGGYRNGIEGYKLSYFPHIREMSITAYGGNNLTKLSMFNGVINNINEFRLICKWLKINRL